MRRRFFTLLLAVSLLFGVGTAALWVRSKSGETQVNVVVLGTRYTLVSQSGQFSLYRPPQIPPGLSNVAALRETVESLHDDQIEWFATFFKGTHQLDFLGGPWPRSGTAADHLMLHDSYPQWLPDGAVPLLLRALDDPNRFIAAHILLTFRSADANLMAHNAWVRSFVWTRYPLHGSGSYDNLDVELEAAALSEPEPSDNPDITVKYQARIAPNQFIKIRDQWHRRLDEHLVSMAYWKLTAGLLSLPGVRLCINGRRLIRTRSRRARRLCPACGYNLIGNVSGTCPECGAAIVASPRSGVASDRRGRAGRYPRLL